jgi:hypothetical protein
MRNKKTNCLTIVINTLLFIPIVFFFTGCTAALLLSANEKANEKKVDKQLSQNSEISDKGLLFSTNDVVKKISPKPIEGSIKSIKDKSGTTFVMEGSTRSKIDLSDPILVYGDSVKYRSNFELYQFHSEENQEYNIIVETFQNQKIGFDKYFMFPLVYLLDANGNILNCNPTTITFKDELIHFFRLNYEGMIKKRDNYFILVGSDNRVSGQTFAKLKLFLDGTFSGPSVVLDQVGSPIGTYNLTLSLKMKQ